ncbi:protein of unknown function [bacterium A37T11]|nr:protein of unknown function [bacterium A37T11]
MKKLIGIIIAVACTYIYACKEEGRLDIQKSDGLAPGVVSDVKVYPKPGGAVLRYHIPTDVNMSYVKAIYEIQPGVFQEGKASIYSDSLTLEGFGDTLQHTVQLISVGKNETESAPLTVQVKPQSPAVYTSFESLVMEQSFGGVKIHFKNGNQANLAIVLLSDTSDQGYWTSLQTFYTKAKEGVFSFRGLLPVKKNYAVYLRDRWNNKSDTLTKALTPLFEEEIPRPFVGLKLPTDEYIEVESKYKLENLWDNDLTSTFATRHNTVLPQWFTVDLGVSAVISRMKVHQRQPDYTYGGGNVKSFELWGSNNPDTDGGWENWKLLGTFNSYKPSGLPLGSISSEDIQYAYTDGEDFELENIPPAYRYVRFKTTNTYDGGPQVTIAEIAFWGQIQK